MRNPVMCDAESSLITCDVESLNPSLSVTILVLKKNMQMYLTYVQFWIIKNKYCDF